MVNLRRRTMVQKEGSSPRLPAAYQEVQYINSVSRSYINLGTKSWSEPGFVCDFLMTKRNNQYGPHIISSAPDNYLWLVPRSYGSNSVVSYLGKQTSGFTPVFPLNKRCVATFNINRDLAFYAEWDGGSSSGTVTTTGTVTSATVYFFAYGGQLSSTYYNLVGQCFSIKIYDEGVLVEDYVPCYRKSDNKAGLYEIIGNNFYTSAGSGNFTAGPNV